MLLHSLCYFGGTDALQIHRNIWKTPFVLGSHGRVSLKKRLSSCLQSMRSLNLVLLSSALVGRRDSAKLFQPEAIDSPHMCSPSPLRTRSIVSGDGDRTNGGQSPADDQPNCAPFLLVDYCRLDWHVKVN